MRVANSMVTSLAAIGLAASLGAQQPRRDPAPMRVPMPEGENCISTDGRMECTKVVTFGPDSASMKRAAIGVQLSPTGTARDTLGVFISRVTPKGPAENAGIVEGERIASINGVDLRVNAADAGDSYAADLPSRRLTREVAKLTPGGVANLRVYSGGRVRDVQVTTASASDLREGGFFGLMQSMPSGGMPRTMSGMQNIRGPLERLRSMDGPGVRVESFDVPRMKLEGSLAPRVRVETMPGTRDRTRVRIYAPSGGHDGAYRTYIIGQDGELTLEHGDKKATEPPKKKK